MNNVKTDAARKITEVWEIGDRIFTNIFKITMKMSTPYSKAVYCMYRKFGVEEDLETVPRYSLI